MNTLIVYASSHGCTETIAEKIQEDLGENVVLLNLKKEPVLSVKEFQRVIIGGSVQSGQIQKHLRTFCIKNLDELLKKEVGLFICCMKEKDAAKQMLMNVYPEELYNSAKSTTVFKSSFDYSRMNFVQKMLARNIKRLRNNSSKVDYEAVQKFSRRMDRVFNPFLFLA